MDEYFKAYIAKGFYLFPIAKGTKKPHIKDNLNQASNSLKQLRAWDKKFNKPNWAISCAKSGLVAIDVDHKYGGMDAWAKFIKKNGEPKTLKAISGGGGLHYLFYAEKNTRYRGQIQKGIDIKYNGYVIIQPSIHKDSGKRYKWVKWGEEFKPMPTWAHDLSTFSPENKQFLEAPELVSMSYLKKLITILRDHTLTYEEWRNLGMAIHTMYPDDEGLELYKYGTQNKAFKQGDLELAGEKWKTFSNAKSHRVTINTICYMVKLKSGDIPRPTAAEDFEALENIDRAKLNALKVQTTWIKSEGELFTWNKQFCVNWMNERGFAILTDGSRHPYFRTINHADGLELKRMETSTVQELTKPYKYLYFKELISGNEVLKEKGVFDIWSNSFNRVAYNALVFKDPDNVGKGELNLYSGFAIKKKSGKPNFILDMLFKSLCGSTELKFNWLLDWLAHSVQTPFSPTSLVPVLISEKQGVGKGILMDHIMKQMYGRYFTAVMSSAELTDKFNLKLAQKLMTFIDEATWRGDKKEDDVMKRIIGSPTITIEEKFGAKYDLHNYSRYFIASNNPEAVAVEIGNRRYVVMETDNKYANNTSFFNPIIKAIEKDEEVGKFFNYLQDRDISKYNPFVPLITTDGGAAKVATAGPVAQFWEDVLFENPQPLFFKKSKGLMLNTAYTYEAFSFFSSQVKSYKREITRAKFWRETKKFLDITNSFLHKSEQVRHQEDKVMAIHIDPKTLMRRFCDTLHIERPKMFNSIDHIANETVQ